MKVDTINLVKSVNLVKSSTKSSSNVNFKEILNAKSAHKSEQQNSVNPLQFYYIEEIPGDLPEQKRKKQVTYGKKLMDELKSIRLALINDKSKLSSEKINYINNLIYEAKDLESFDPKLNNIIKDIELRLAVEIAKLS